MSGPPALPRTQEKPEKLKTKQKPPDVTRRNPFANVTLTGPQAKEEIPKKHLAEGQK